MNTASSEHTASTAGQSLHRDCLGPYHVTCVHFPGETAQRFPVSGGIDGKTLQAARVNRLNGKIVRERAYDLRPDSKVELFATDWPGLYFIVTYDRYRERYSCSCEQPYCEHIRTARAISR